MFSESLTSSLDPDIPAFLRRTPCSAPPAVAADALLARMREMAPLPDIGFADEELARLVASVAGRLSVEQVDAFVRLGVFMNRRMGYVPPLLQHEEIDGWLASCKRLGGNIPPSTLPAA